MSFKVNKEKLKDDFLKHIRRERIKSFSELDVEYQRADEENDTVKKVAIVQKKNELRDFPDTITTGSFEGWNDLKAMWPTGSIPNVPKQWRKN
tara:strand:+ start:30 stop:308 length:279 start_codon:yes stop_codon:yes gene_type:complete